MSDLYSLLRPLLFALPPETAHKTALTALTVYARLRSKPAVDQTHGLSLFGRRFPNPIGLAAGFDKNATAIAGAFALGFGFVEVGTVTPKPQPGNARPRLFRLTADRALINRMGFNNDGFDAVYPRVARARARGLGPIGVNLGANKASEDKIADYAAGVRRFADVAHYLTINVSSPNTPGLRALQSREALERLLGRIMEARGQSPRRVPILLKIAPDLTPDDKQDIAAAVLSLGVDGLIVSNTTVARPPDLRSRRRTESGGLSGAPLRAPSTELIAEMRRLTDGRVPLVGVGGIMDAADAEEKFAAGARLLQLYTGLVFEGPALLRRLHVALT